MRVIFIDDNSCHLVVLEHPFIFCVNAAELDSD